MLTTNRNLFTNIPVEYSIPKSSRVVFVSDFFTSDLQGGAELTTDAIIKKAPPGVKSFKLHSSSFSVDLLERNRDKHWVLCNFTNTPSDTLQTLIDARGTLSYSVVEYDFKNCIYRSSYRHMLETGKPCDCINTEHGRTIEELYSTANQVFWMSARQRDIASRPKFNRYNNLVLSSVFDDSTLDFLKSLREKTVNKQAGVHAILGGGSWIKGTEQTEAWCKHHNKNYVKVASVDYRKFLEQLAVCETFVFRPLDYDTCPRTVIEAKLLGLKLSLNENVLHQDEEWFTGSIEDTENYLRNNAARKFWFLTQPLIKP